jgi:hypothetical protein
LDVGEEKGQAVVFTSKAFGITGEMPVDIVFDVVGVVPVEVGKGENLPGMALEGE